MWPAAWERFCHGKEGDRRLLHGIVALRAFPLVYSRVARSSMPAAEPHARHVRARTPSPSVRPVVRVRRGFGDS